MKHITNITPKHNRLEINADEFLDLELAPYAENLSGGFDTFVVKDWGGHPVGIYVALSAGRGNLEVEREILYDVAGEYVPPKPLPQEYTTGTVAAREEKADDLLREALQLLALSGAIRHHLGKEKQK